MNIMVLSRKGGVGKSAFSMQLIAPYLLSRFGEANLYEIDDNNFDASDYESSLVDCKSITVGKGVSLASDALQEELILGNSVIDVGGGDVTKELIEAVGEDGIHHMLSAVVIPVSQTGKDVELAKKTLIDIRRCFVDFKGKVIFGVTRIPGNYDLDDVEYVIPDLFALAEEMPVDGVVTLPEDQSVPGSRRFGLTAWELAVFNKDHVEGIHKGMVEEHRKGKEADPKRIKMLSRQSRYIQGAIKLRPLLEERFDALDELLGVTPEMKEGGLLASEGRGDESASRAQEVVE